MVNPELYRDVTILGIPGHTLRELGGTLVTPKITPLIDGHIEAFCTISVNGKLGKAEGPSGSRLVQISPLHGRSYELRFGRTGSMIWADEYGNIFTVLTTKGNNLNEPTVVRNSSAPSGFAFWGLQESDSIVRVLRTSELLRSHGIDTEIILRVIQPEQLPIKGKLVPLVDFKSQLVQQIWKQKPRKKQNSEDGRLTRVDVPELSKILEETTFFITVRGLQVAERIEDLMHCVYEEDLITMMRKVFKVVNLSEQAQAKKDPQYSPQIFNVDNKEDIIRYLTDYLPKRVSSNLAQMHNLGLAHRFPHAGNISLAGGLYDLDSVHGKPTQCGDEEISILDMRKDLDFFLNGGGSSQGAKDILYDLAKHFKRIKSGPELFDAFRNNLFKQYVTEKGWTDPIAHSVDIYTFFSLSQNREDWGYLEFCVAVLSEQLGWDYQYQVSIEELEALILKEKGEFWRGLAQASIEGKEKEYIDDLEKNQKLEDKIKLFGSDFSKLLFERIATDLEEKCRAKIDILASIYGQEKTNGIVALFVSRELQKSLKVISSNFLDAKLEDEVYKNYIASLGWEEDLAAHIVNLSQLFDNFADIGSDEIIGHYASLISEQLGWDFVNSEAISSLIAIFHEEDQKRFEKLCRTVIEIATEEEKKDIKVLLEKAQYNDQYFNDSFPQDRFTAFIVDRLLTKIKESLNQYLTSRGLTFDPDTLEAIGALFESREERKIFDIMNPEMDNEIDSGGWARTQKVLNEIYLQYSE